MSTSATYVALTPTLERANQYRPHVGIELEDTIMSALEEAILPVNIADNDLKNGVLSPDSGHTTTGCHEDDSNEEEDCSDGEEEDEDEDEDEEVAKTRKRIETNIRMVIENHLKAEELTRQVKLLGDVCVRFFNPTYIAVGCSQVERDEFKTFVREQGKGRIGKTAMLTDYVLAKATEKGTKVYVIV